MKRLLISTAAIALMSSGAFAADLPVFEPAPEVVPVASVYDWSGFYVGLHVGGAFLTDEDDTTLTYNGALFGGGVGGICAPAGGRTCPATLGHEEDEGFLAGGGHAGFQGQWGIWVAGIEADITYLDLDDDAFDDDGDGERGVTRNPGIFGAGTTDVFQTTGFNEDDEENNLLGTVRGKLGVAFDRVLVYGTGGLALTSAENTEAFVGFGRNALITTPAQPFVFAFSEQDGDDEDEIALGFAVGGGIDVAVTDNFIIGAQALYFNVENDDDDDDTLTCDPALSAAGCGGLAGQTITVGGENEFEGVIATVRGSYKFNFGGNM